MDGGTFSISNGGVFGSMFGTPIINPPQSAILGMHAIFDRPVAINGKVSYGVFQVFCFSCDWQKCNKGLTSFSVRCVGGSKNLVELLFLALLCA